MAAVRTLPWSWYADEAQHRRELEAVFLRAWQYVGHLGELPEPGSYVASRAAHLPVVVTRDGEGEVRALLNVCRHRGHPVAAGAATRTTLQCPYHAWTYGLDGALRTAPRAAPGETDGLALRPLRIEAWGPFLFVNPDPAAAPLVEALGPLPGLLDVEGLEHRLRAESELAADWKVVCENYLECYHCAVAHPSFSARVDVSPAAYRLVDEGPVLSQFGPTRDGAEEGHFHLIWPNTVVNVYPGARNVSIGPVLPAGPGRTARFLDYFVAPDADPAWWDDLLALDDTVGREDAALVEAVQRGLGTRLVEEGRLLAEAERLVASFQARVRDAVSR